MATLHIDTEPSASVWHSLWYRRVSMDTLSHYNDVIMGSMASQITSLIIVYSAVYSGADQRKHQSSASLAFVRGIHRWPANSPRKGPVTRKMIPFDDVIISDFTFARKRSWGIWHILWNSPLEYKLTLMNYTRNRLYIDILNVVMIFIFRKFHSTMSTDECGEIFTLNRTEFLCFCIN